MPPPEGGTRNSVQVQLFPGRENCVYLSSEGLKLAGMTDIEDVLLESMAIQAAVSAEGFDWPDVTGVLDKVDEEVQEIREALDAGDRRHARKELGDLLLVTVNLARFLDASPREELRAATRRFENRFDFLKKSLAAEGKSIKSCAAGQLEERWQAIKPGADQRLSEGA